MLICAKLQTVLYKLLMHLRKKDKQQESAVKKDNKKDPMEWTNKHFLSCVDLFNFEAASWSNMLNSILKSSQKLSYGYKTKPHLSACVIHGWHYIFQ